MLPKFGVQRSGLGDTLNFVVSVCNSVHYIGTYVVVEDNFIIYL